MAEVFGVVAGAVGLAFQIAKLIAGANRLYDKYKELEPNVRKLNSTLVSLKAIVPRLDSHTPLLPGEFVNGVPTELINGLKEDIDRATQVVDRINNSSGFAPKFRNTIPKYSKEIDKVSSDFKVSLLVLIAFQVRDIKDDTNHIRALATKETTEKGDTTTAVLNVNTSHTNEIIEEDTTTDKKIDKKMSLQLDQIYEDVSRLSSRSKTARLLTGVRVKEEEVTVTAGTSTSRVAGVVAEEDDRETTCGVCRKCYGLAEYWIQCNICEKWFHGTCVLITPGTAEQHFRCRACSH